jgi:hypothetical protein
MLAASQSTGGADRRFGAATARFGRECTRPTIMRPIAGAETAGCAAGVRDRGLPLSRTPCLITHLLSGRATGRRAASADSECVTRDGEREPTRGASARPSRPTRGSSRRVSGATAPMTAGSRPTAAIKARWLPTKIDSRPFSRDRSAHGQCGGQGAVGWEAAQVVKGPREALREAGERGCSHLLGCRIHPDRVRRRPFRRLAAAHPGRRTAGPRARGRRGSRGWAVRPCRWAKIRATVDLPAH